jgi:hypothetical protein
MTAHGYNFGDTRPQAKFVIARPRFRTAHFLRSANTSGLPPGSRRYTDGWRSVGSRTRPLVGQDPPTRGRNRAPPRRTVRPRLPCVGALRPAPRLPGKPRFRRRRVRGHRREGLEPGRPSSGRTSSADFTVRLLLQEPRGDPAERGGCRGLSGSGDTDTDAAVRSSQRVGVSQDAPLTRPLSTPNIPIADTVARVWQ